MRGRDGPASPVAFLLSKERGDFSAVPELEREVFEKDLLPTRVQPTRTCGGSGHPKKCQPKSFKRLAYFRHERMSYPGNTNTDTLLLLPPKPPLAAPARARTQS